MRVGVLLGIILALVNFGRLLLLNHTTAIIALIVSISMFLTVILAKALGCTLPLLAKSVGLDPALMASPLITTIVDACSLLILFSIATRLLV